MTNAERRAHRRREQMILRKARLGDPEVDPAPVFGADAVSLVYRLTRTSYSLAGHALPRYTRDRMPCKFVPGRPT
jgi:hypothetical protein